jgi:hypothetical protein
VLAFLRRLLPLLTVVVLAAVAYDGWIFYSRRQWQHDVERAHADAEAERDRKAIDAIGGGAFGIRNFYAAPAAIRPGQTATLCYSVFGAVALRLDPPVAEVYPALTHCIQATPRQTAEFTLTATDSAGHTATSKLVVKVVR